MLKLRVFHQYFAVFFAPAILFFAFSGFFQTGGLHEVRGRPNYVPPHWIVVMASIHKDQRLPHEDADHDDDHDRTAKPAAHEHSGPPPDNLNAPSTWPLKFFVMCLSAGLIATTLMGLVIAWNNRARRSAATLVFLAGLALPIVLLFL